MCYNKPIRHQSLPVASAPDKNLAGTEIIFYRRASRREPERRYSMEKRKTFFDLKTLCLLGSFAAIELVMKLMGLGSVPVGPLNMSFLTVPVAVGAMLIGPMGGCVLGTVFGLCSLWDAVSGASVMTGIFFSISPVHTVILCVVTRALMGLLTGLLFHALKKVDRAGVVSYFVSAFAAPFLNTLLFMGYIVLAFYGTEYVQGLVGTKGATNPFMFVVLLVGVQGLVEMLVCTLVAGGVSKGVAHAMRLK